MDEAILVRGLLLASSLRPLLGIGIVILVVYFMIWRRRRCQPDPLESSSSTTALRRAAENSRSNFPPELCNGAIAAHEMDSPDNEACESDTTEKYIFELGTGNTDWQPSPQPRKLLCLSIRDGGRTRLASCRPPCWTRLETQNRYAFTRLASCIASSFWTG